MYDELSKSYEFIISKTKRTVIIVIGYKEQVYN